MQATMSVLEAVGVARESERLAGRKRRQKSRLTQGASDRTDRLASDSTGSEGTGSDETGSDALDRSGRSSASDSDDSGSSSDSSDSSSESTGMRATLPCAPKKKQGLRRVPLRRSSAASVGSVT